MFRSVFFSLMVLLSSSSLAEDFDFRDFDSYQDKIEFVAVRTRLGFLEKSSQIRDHFTLDRESLKLYANAEDKAKDIPEYVLRLAHQLRPSEIRPNPGIDPAHPLAGARIALDPGHIGGSVARTEARYLDIPPGPQVGDRALQFDEGTLSVATALHLRTLLQKAGATVLLTRSQPGEYVADVTYPEWRRSKAFDEAVENKVASVTDAAKREAEKKWWLETATDAEVFRGLYNSVDLRARVAKINAFQPDLTLAIHYNVGNTTGNNRVTDKNFNMVFAPGAFMAGELAAPEARYHFLRLLVTKDLDHSLEVSERLIEAFTRKLTVAAVKEGESAAPYLQKTSIFTGTEGVYARNFGINRMVRGPIAYGESLCQDNVEECRRLAEQSFEIDGIRTSPRVKEVAEAYYQATLSVFPKRN